MLYVTSPTFPLGNGAMLHGLKDKVWPAYQEVQASNLSKACTSEEEAQATVESTVRRAGRTVPLRKGWSHIISSIERVIEK
jgi:hypothetical protein